MVSPVIRTHPLKALVAALMLLVGALAWSYTTRDSVPVPRTVDPAPGESLVVVGVGGISWDDVSAEDTPVLWGLPGDIPLAGDQTPGKCFLTGQPSAKRAVFAKAY